MFKTTSEFAPVTSHHSRTATRIAHLVPTIVTPSVKAPLGRNVRPALSTLRTCAPAHRPAPSVSSRKDTSPVRGPDRSPSPFRSRKYVPSMLWKAYVHQALHQPSPKMAKLSGESNKQDDCCGEESKTTSRSSTASKSSITLRSAKCEEPRAGRTRCPEEPLHSPLPVRCRDRIDTTTEVDEKYFIKPSPWSRLKCTCKRSIDLPCCLRAKEWLLRAYDSKGTKFDYARYKRQYDVCVIAGEP